VTQRATLGWVIVYVPDVKAALSFYERAFGLTQGFIDASASFGQLETGTTALAFATEERMSEEFDGEFERARIERPPFNVELCLVFDDVEAAFRHAVACGCTPRAEPEHKPHGQTASYVRDPFGTLIEIASPLEGR
jgi:catechol 2,3-dioxygenase-like lactoylglutathione lyase family enzyme